MNEMQLFEIGFKTSLQDNNYWEKVQIAAKDTDEAMIVARKWLVADIESWYDDEEEEQTPKEELLKMPLARIQHLGRVIVSSPVSK